MTGTPLTTRYASPIVSTCNDIDGITADLNFSSPSAHPHFIDIILVDDVIECSPQIVEKVNDLHWCGLRSECGERDDIGEIDA